MPLEEVTFNNVNGEEISLSNLVSQMINYYEQKLEIGETKITDFNEGSEIRNILEAFAILGYAIMEEQNDNSKIAFINLSEGGWLDRIGELPFINLERITGAEAEGNLTFSIETALEEEYTIPAETIVESSETGMEYITLNDCVIPAGELSATVIAECMVVGSEGNVPAGSIDTITDDTVDTELVSVTNEYAFENGSDYEEDEEYRERLLATNQKEGFGSIGHYKDLCESVDGVHDVKLIDNATYTKKVIVNGFSKPVEDSVYLDVITELSKLENLVVKHSFLAEKVAYTSVSLTINLDVTTEIPNQDLLDNLTAFFNGTAFDRIEYDGLNIDEPLTYEKVASCFSLFGDVINVTDILYGGSTLTSITPTLNTVFKVGTITFNQNEVQ